MKKQIPILFSTAMVQAILAGRKTQTRRLVKPKTPEMSALMHNIYAGANVDHCKEELIRCNSPYGTPGDFLWVKETFYAYGWWVQEGTAKSGKPGWTFKDFTVPDQGGRYHYVTNPPDEVIQRRVHQRMGWYKRPAIFMPYEAARIWLGVYNSKAELLDEISDEDVYAEGIAQITKDGGRTWKYGIPDSDGYPGTDDVGWPWSEWCKTPRDAFFKLWDQVNGKESRDVNPLLYVTSFRGISCTGKPAELDKEGAV